MKKTCCFCCCCWYTAQPPPSPPPNTGTGKTLAFLIPAIEVLIREKARHSKGDRAAAREGSVAGPAPLVLVLSPTRELALQIAAEAKQLCTFHKLGVVTLVGGTNVDTDRRALNRPSGGVDIVVASPGRILDHLQETPGFSKRCAGVKVLVLDEADRLLDMG